MKPILITLKPLLHKEKMRIAILYDFNTSINKVVKQIDNTSWSQTHKCWHIPYSVAGYKQLLAALQPLAEVDLSLLQAHQKNKTYSTKPLQKRDVAKPENKIETKLPIKKATVAKGKHSAANQQWLQRSKELLELKAYSPSTIKTYNNELSVYFTTLGMVDASTMSIARIKDYLLYCINELKLTENTIHSRLNALKFFYEQVLSKEKFFVELPRPKKHSQLPRLLSEVEIGRLFNALANKKHKAILFTVYSAGLRVSEVVNLQIQDVDSGRMQLFIRKSKGKKDRYVNLSPILLDILRQYLQIYTPKPQTYLFESEQTGLAYPTRTVQQIFTNAKNKAGIAKTVGIHSLRHSFATHLLEKGTDIKYIKDLLGHFDIRTTEIYLHVAKQSLVNIVSPLDDLWKKENINW